MTLTLPMIVALACSGTEAPSRSGGPEANPAAPAAVASGEPAPEPGAGEVGILGYYTNKGVFRTLQITNKGFRTLGDGLAVPRKDGWWWLGMIGQDGLEPLILWSSPFGTFPAAPPIDTSSCSEIGIETRLTFVGKDYISQEVHTGGMCEGAAHPWQSHDFVTTAFEAPSVVNEDKTFTNHGEPIDLAEIAGEAAAKALIAAGEKAREEGECLGAPSTKQWGLVRHQGGWVVRGGLSYEAEACRDSYASFEVDVPAPEALLKDIAPLKPSWEEWAAKVPGLVDVSASPSGDLAILITDKGVKLKVGDDLEADELYVEGAQLVMTWWSDDPLAFDSWPADALAVLPGRSRQRGGVGRSAIPGKTPDIIKQGEADKARQQAEAPEAAAPAPENK